MSEDRHNTEHQSEENESDVDIDALMEGGEETDDDEYEQIDLTDNPLYQVLSAFFENEDSENICDMIGKLTDAVRENTKMMAHFLKTVHNPPQNQPQQSSNHRSNHSNEQPQTPRKSKSSH